MLAAWQHAPWLARPRACAGREWVHLCGPASPQPEAALVHWRVHHTYVPSQASSRALPCCAASGARARQVVLSDELADAQRVLPALEAVATPALRDRHWRQIFALLGLDQARPRSAFPFSGFT